MNTELIVAGFTIGTLVGLTGVGGGSLMTPLLVFMGLNPLIAVGTDLLYSLPTKMLGWFLHNKQGTTNKPVVSQLCIGGIPGSVVGLTVLYLIGRVGGEHLLLAFAHRAIGVAVCLSAVMILIAPIILKRRRERLEQQPPALPAGIDAKAKARLITIGAVVGFIVALTSIGGGSMALPLIVLVLPQFGIAELVGSDIAFAAILVFFSSIGHWKMNHVDLNVTANLLCGSLIGVFIGTKFCKILQQQWLRPALAVVLIVAGTRILA